MTSPVSWIRLPSAVVGPNSTIDVAGSPVFHSTTARVEVISVIRTSVIIGGVQSAVDVAVVIRGLPLPSDGRCWS